MVREKVRVSTRTLQWKCVESRIDSKRLYYGRFVWAFSLMFLFSGRGYWQELIESIVS